ncbi:hypothetical protein BC835DRAFT_1310703 [Cytidiella melzeri]|nr:hypothetical protein BC835DRAFT_1310703 [Cytidiella melzeri]
MHFPIPVMFPAAIVLGVLCTVTGSALASDKSSSNAIPTVLTKRGVGDDYERLHLFNKCSIQHQARVFKWPFKKGAQVQAEVLAKEKEILQELYGPDGLLATAAAQLKRLKYTKVFRLNSNIPPASSSPETPLTHEKVWAAMDYAAGQQETIAALLRNPKHRTPMFSITQCPNTVTVPILTSKFKEILKLSEENRIEFDRRAWSTIDEE